MVARQPFGGNRCSGIGVAGGRPRLPAPVHRAAGGDREHDAPRPRSPSRALSAVASRASSAGRPASGRSASSTVTVRSSPPRSRVSSIASPGCFASTAAITSSIVGDRLAVDLDDQVAAGADRLAVDRDLGVAGLDPGLVGGAVGDHRLHQGAAVDVEVEHVGDLGRQVGAADAEEGVLDLAVVDQLLGDLLGGVDRDREADADVAARWPPDSICELIPITAPVGVDQRAAGVAGVDRGVGLDRVGDREPVRGADLRAGPRRRSRRSPCGRARTGCRSRPPGRRPRPRPRSRRARAAASASAPGVDLEHGDVGRRVGAEHLGVVGLAVLAAERDRDLVGAVDDVGVGEDVAVRRRSRTRSRSRCRPRRGAERVERARLRPAARPR